MAMATYILLANFTDQGVRNAQDSPKRADAFKEMAKKCKANVKDLYWTLGQYDAVTIVEAPDDMTATALALSLGKLGNVRTQTLPAFSAADMKTIIGKMA
jgi:uncharacterized protein with GYD domain